jgi:hypothetical protein
VKGNVVKCSVGKGCKRGVIGGKVMRSEGLGAKSMCAIWWEKKFRNYVQYFLQLVLFSLCAFLRTVFVLRVLSSYVYLLHLILYLLHYVCTAAFTLVAGLLARSHYPEDPATGHLDTGFSWFPCVYKRMLRWFLSFQVAITCLSCSPPDLNFPVTLFHICVNVK